MPVLATSHSPNRLNQQFHIFVLHRVSVPVVPWVPVVTAVPWVPVVTAVL